MTGKRWPSMRRLRNGGPSCSRCKSQPLHEKKGSGGRRWKRYSISIDLLDVPRLENNANVSGEFREPPPPTIHAFIEARQQRNASRRPPLSAREPTARGWLPRHD